MCVCCVFFCYRPVVEAWLQCRTDCARWTAGRESFRVMSRLLVSLLFVRVPRSVLDIGRARTQAVQVTTVLCIIDMILEEHLWGGKIKNAGHWEQAPLISYYLLEQHLASSKPWLSPCEIQILMWFFPVLCGTKLFCEVIFHIGKTSQLSFYLLALQRILESTRGFIFLKIDIKHIATLKKNIIHTSII